MMESHGCRLGFKPVARIPIQHLQVGYITLIDFRKVPGTRNNFCVRLTGTRAGFKPNEGLDIC